MVPTLTVGLLGGPVTDAMDRRKLALITSSGLAVVAAALTIQAFAGLSVLWLLYVLVALQASLNAVDRPARSTFIPGLLPAGQLAAGLALDRLSFQITLTAGPARPASSRPRRTWACRPATSPTRLALPPRCTGSPACPRCGHRAERRGRARVRSPRASGSSGAAR